MGSSCLSEEFASSGFRRVVLHKTTVNISSTRCSTTVRMAQLHHHKHLSRQHSDEIKALSFKVQ
jgi:hypothetical protein